MAQRLKTAAAALLGIALIGGLAAPAAAWEPAKPVEFIVPAGTGGGADQMARLVASIVDKHKLSPRPLVVVNKAGGAGAEGFTYVKAKSGDAHTIIITLSNLFTTPLHTGVPFNWKDLTPVARLALDEFILWVNAETPYKSAKEYMEAVKKGKDGKPFSMGGTGSAQEDQIITILLEQALGVKFAYVPFKGGGEVCANLVGNHVDSTVNNPIECAGHWKAGRVRPLAVFDVKRLTAPGWGDIPTAKEALGADISYLMLRGIFGTPSMPADAVAFYQGMLQKVYDSPEFMEYISKGALNAAWQTGTDFVKWLEGAEAQHKDLMKKGGLLK
jgi:putative tricarboxylic transport membrane protein